MAIPSKQIGWSQESNILHEIAKQLYKIGKFTGGTIGPTAITGLGAPDEVVFFTAAQAISGNGNLFWRNPLGRLSIGDDTVATQTLDVTGGAKATSYTIVNGGDIITPSAGNINIPGNLGLGVTVGTNPTQRLDVAGNISLLADLTYGIFGTTSAATAMWSFGTVDTLGGQPNDDSLSINALGGLSFGEGGAALNFQQNIVIYPTTGNVVIQNGGVFTDTGEKLKVTGNTLVDGNLVTTNSINSFRGTGANASSVTLTLNDGDGRLAYRFRNDGRLYFGNGSNLPNNSPHFQGAINTQIFTIRSVGGSDYEFPYGCFNFSTINPITTNTGGNQVGVRIGINFAPISGSCTFVALQVNNSIPNEISRASRGVYINPTFPNPPTNFKGIDIFVNNETGRIRHQFYALSTGPIFHANDINYQFETTTGTKFGVVNSQRLAFWNATPAAQPTTAVASATYVDVASTIIKTSDTFDEYTFGQVVRALRNMGLLA